jgi:multidrug resistance efflux pump
MKRMAEILSFFSLFALCGCTSLGLTPATNATGTLTYAYTGVQTAYQQIAQLAATGTLSKPVAMKAYNAVSAVKASLDAASAAATSSAPVAVSVISSATAALTQIAAYLTCNQQTPGSTSCQL